MKTSDRKLSVALTIWSLTLLLVAVTAMTAHAQTSSDKPPSSDMPTASDTRTASGDTVSKNKLPPLFYQANGFYEKGQFQEAVDSYQKMLTSGYESGNLYFNLGNAYFKLGNKGRAILYYEKARRLIPGDADLKANLTYAQTGSATGAAIPAATGSATDPVTVDWKVELFNTLNYLAPVNQLFAFSSVGFFLLIGLFIYVILFPAQVRNPENKLKGLWLGAILTVGIVFIISIALTTLTLMEHNKRQAVALQADVTAFFEPKTDATLYYHMSEGNKVQIMEEKGAWWLVKRQDGKRGWVEQKKLAEI